MNYIKEAKRTDLQNYFPAIRRIEKVPELLHAVLGLTTEVGELTDVIKKFVMYGKPIDYINFEEEIGDIMWYLAIACEYCDVSFEELQERNINKLKARFPDKFTEEKALNRDLETERNILEKA